jgi:type IV secretory pathway TrbF-like protein
MEDPRMAAANSYAEGWREWDERYADLVIGKRNWQIVAAAFAAVSIVLAVGMVWQSARSRYVPYIVEVDKLGYALTQAQPLTAGRRGHAQNKEHSSVLVVWAGCVLGSLFRGYLTGTGSFGLGVPSLRVAYPTRVGERLF